MAMARDVARAQKQAEAARQRAAREQDRHYRASLREIAREERENLRSLKEQAREEKLQYLEDRQEEAATLAAEAQQTEDELSGMLGYTLLVNDRIDFDALRITEMMEPFEPSSGLRLPDIRPSLHGFLANAKVPFGWRKMLPGAEKRRGKALEEAQARFDRADAEWQTIEAERVSRYEAEKRDYDARLAAFEEKKASRDAEVDAFRSEYEEGDPNAIVSYCTMVLERSQYPVGLPQKFSVAFTRASKQLVVEYELPTIDIVPAVMEFRYNRSQDDIVEKPRKPAEIKSTYQDVIASIALRTLHELFEAEDRSHVEVICFNGYIHTVDPATGRDTQPHLISVRTTRQKFLEIDLSRVDKKACLKNLGAQVSRSPEEAQPVKPIMEFKMADARFVDQTDLISGLAEAPNLMDLNPFEFEQLVANLFGQMGLESKLTRSSKDGGVDCVAFDRRPVLGGKVVIQAKRYRHTVGVSAVRDLFGTMMNEGANKGILVTTSGYGSDAFNFAKDKPIELIDGGGLLYLLQEIGTQARIVFPEEA